ncbi:NUDIX domain-containing protein [Lutibacter sp. B2]|nr:NUDIX domain-containing protein [Lutibacter sp. B2]
MRLINKYIHKSFTQIIDPVIFERTAARGIILDNEDILMIYTKRYNDYSFPGGGVDDGEDIEEGLIRELKEETGAKNIEIASAFGDYEEFRPTHYEGYDIVHMRSHFFVCSAEKELGVASPEDYEISNGSVPVWVNIHAAIKHNQEVIAAKEDSMGLSIERETLVLELVATELL